MSATAIANANQSLCDLSITRIFDAPRELVFEAFSNPEHAKQWMGPRGFAAIYVEQDVRPGGKWRSDGVGADGKTFYVEGEYLEVDPPRLLVHTWIGSYSGPLKTVVRWELEPHTVHGLHPSGPKKSGTGTLVRVRQDGFAGNLENATSHGEGWKRVLGWLEGYLERSETVSNAK